MKTTLLSITATFVLFVTACAPVSQIQYEKKGLKPLSTKTIEKLLSGRTVILEAIDFNATVTFQENKKIVAKDLSGGEESGGWTLEPEDLICIKFSTWNFGDLNCYRVIEDDDKILFFTQNGAIRYTGTSKTQVPAKGIKAEAQNRSTFTETSQTAGTGKVQPPHADKESTKEKFTRLAKNCPGCNLSGVDLSGADLAGANLAGADLSHTDFTGANLRLANLTGANLSHALLQRTNLPGANLTGADLTGANLRGSNLIRANITNATIINTDFSGAHLESIQGKTQ